MRYALYFLALTILGMWQPAAKSAEISVQSGTDFSLIFVVGDLAPGDHLRFIQLALPIQRGIVILGSDGGNLQAGLEIGKAIRLKDFGTYVPDNVVCASACAFAWLGGTRRFMASAAQIGFHAAFRMENGAARESGVGNAILGAYLNALGLSQRAIEFVTSADPSRMQWLTLSNASNFGIEVTRLDLQPPTAPPSAKAPTTGGTAPMARSSGRPPQFRDYMATSLHDGPNAPLILTGPAWNYRTRLISAARSKPNFGGRYIVVTWGCGTTCLTGAVIDAPTGRVTMLPFSICCAKASHEKFNPIEFRKNSNLIVFAGLRNETEPMGAHFYKFDGEAFQFIQTIQDDGYFVPR